MLLMPAPNGEDHAPVAAHKIGLPGAAAFRLEQRLMSPAKRAQTPIAWKDNPLRRVARPSWILPHHSANQPAIQLNIGCGQRRIETSMEEKLARRPDHDKAPMGVSRGRRVARNDHFAGRGVEMVLPHQLIGESEGIALELKPAAEVV